MMDRHFRGLQGDVPADLLRGLQGPGQRLISHSANLYPTGSPGTTGVAPTFKIRVVRTLDQQAARLGLLDYITGSELEI